MDLVAQLAPALGPAAGAEPFGDLDRPVEGDPGHHLRMREMLRRPAHLPDTLVRLIPDLSQMRKNDLADCGAAVDRRQAVQMGLVERVEDLTKDIELNLVCGVVTDTHRLRAFVAWQPRHLPLSQSPLAAEPVHDLDLVRLWTAACTRVSPRTGEGL